MEKVFCDRCGCECTKDYHTGGLSVMQLGGRGYNYLCPSCNEYVKKGRDEEIEKIQKAISKAEARARRHL